MKVRLYDNKSKVSIRCILLTDTANYQDYEPAIKYDEGSPQLAVIDNS